MKNGSPPSPTAIAIAYDHGQDVPSPPLPANVRRRRAAAAWLAGAFLLAAAAFSAWLLLPAAGLAAAALGQGFARGSHRSRILLAPRYLVVGNTVVHYGLADEIRISESGAELLSEGRILLSVRLERFHSVSSKPVKRELNRRRRFDRFVQALRGFASAENPSLRWTGSGSNHGH